MGKTIHKCGRGRHSDGSIAVAIYMNEDDAKKQGLRGVYYPRVKSQELHNYNKKLRFPH